MIWPPIRFANSTTILDPPTPLPTPPTWTLSDAQCRAALEKQKSSGGLRWRLVTLLIDGPDDADPWGVEGVWAGNEIAGQALVEEHASTTVVLPGDKLAVDPFGNLMIAVGAPKKAG